VNRRHQLYVQFIVEKLAYAENWFKQPGIGAPRGNSLVLVPVVSINYRDIFCLNGEVAVSFTYGDNYKSSKRHEIPADKFPTSEELVKLLTAAGVGLHYDPRLDQGKPGYFNGLSDKPRKALLNIRVRA
jgi:hypothetical protein